MARYEIIVGSVLGASEYVADALEQALQGAGHQVQIHLQPNLDELARNATWLICTSTHGAGDLPDNIQPFAAQLTNADLNGIDVLAIGLGDSSYDTFCLGVMQIAELLQSAGATLLAEPLQIDVLNHPIPEDPAVAWLNEKLQAQS